MLKRIKSILVFRNCTFRLAQPFSSSLRPADEPPKSIDFTELHFETKVPQRPCPSAGHHFQSYRTEIDGETLKLLERLSLVNVDDRQALRTLEDSIEFASKILDIDTDNVPALYTVLEDQPLQMRDDVVTDGDCQEEILKNARITEEEYFVAPPGNIPLDQSDHVH